QAPSSQISPVAHSSSFSHASPGGDGSDLPSSLHALTVSPTLTEHMSDNIHLDHCVFMTIPHKVAPNARAESPEKASSRREINAKGYVVRCSRQKKRPHALLLQATRYPCEHVARKKIAKNTHCPCARYIFDRKDAFLSR